MKKTSCLFLFLFLLGFATDIQGQTLHALIFSDTKDPKIGLGSENAKRTMEDEASIISKKTGMRLKRYYFSGEECKAARMKNVVANMECESNDVILFFYSGHGYNEGEGTWPTLVLRGVGESVASRSVRLDWVIRQLKAKEPRLLVMLNQSCNKERGNATARTANVPANNAGLMDHSARHYKELFLYKKGYFIMTSSKKGQFSLIDGQGGYFVQGFIEALHKEVDGTRSAEADWDNIYRSAVKNTKEIAEAEFKEQEPYGKRYLSPASSSGGGVDPGQYNPPNPPPSNPAASCSTCSGSGHFHANVTCGTCDGHGKLKYKSTCTGCGGTGEVRGMCGGCAGQGGHLHNCNACGGYGGFNTPCGACNGYGVLICSACGGGGVVRDAYGRQFYCNGCGGYGKLTCGTCNGAKGFVQACNNCAGRGQVPHACDYCGGSGEARERHNVCRGTGSSTDIVNCNACNGKGKKRVRKTCHH